MPNMAPSYRHLKEAEDDGVELMAELGFASLQEAIEHKDPLIFARAALKRDTRSWGPPPFFRATLDGYVFDKSYEQNLLQGPRNDVPILTGHNAQEGGTYAEPRFTVDDFETCVGERLGRGSNFEKKYKELYPLADEEEGKGPLAAWNSSCQEQTRTSMLEWSRLWKINAKSPVYGYYFTHHPPPYHGFKPDFSPPKISGYTMNKGPLVGAFHGSEFAYTFNSVVTNDQRPWTEKDRQLGNVISKLWSNFIKYGDPNGRPGSKADRPEGVSPWPPLTEQPNVLLELGGDFNTIPIARPEAIELWAAHSKTGKPY